MIPRLDIRHVSIIDSLPVINTTNEVLTVGCGDCKIDYHLLKMGFDVCSTDFYPEAVRYDFDSIIREYDRKINICDCNIFDINTFLKPSYESVICSEVLEHLLDYKKAFQNLLNLSDRRLIITVPFEHSYDDHALPPKGHCNYWSDSPTDHLLDINEIKEMSFPFAVSIQKIRTKPRDVEMKQCDYLIVVDKNQAYQ